MKEFRLWIEIRGGYYTDVEANSLEEAIEIATGRINPSEMEIWDCDAEEV